MADEGTAQSQRTAPLAGLRVLDLTSVVLGPLATQTLGDMGADVIKIEPPDGDIMRYAEPARSPGMGAVFLNSNRNKRSVVLDLKDDAARAAVLALVRSADIFIHSMRPQAIAKLGLDYEAVSAVRPDVIYCATWGFGSDGPYAGQPAYDDVIQGLSGLADLFRKRSGRDPEFAPTILADKVTGLTAYGAILTALFHRERTGQGQKVEVPMFETMAAFNLVENLTGHVFVPPVGPMGYARVTAPERRPYRTADGYMAVLPYSTRHWIAFFQAIGRDDLVNDPRVRDPATRSRHVGELYQIIDDVMPSRTNAQWSAILRKADVPSVIVPELEHLETDPHLQEVGFFEPIDHPSEGPIQTTRVPVKYSQSPGTATDRPAPRLGQHTREVLATAGLSDDAIEALIKTGAAASSDA